ncbi:MAG: protein kinase [Synechococcales cyanobacterium RM1_1_8]|nr:protein kinase [Synechococcales cyanobacterium RM1_1_8]
MSDLITFQPGVTLHQGKYLLRSVVQPGRWSLTLPAIRAADLSPVIVKTPIAALAQARFQSAWMRRTFQALVDFHHPSRARVLDWFEQDGRPFLVFQQVKGQALAQPLANWSLTEAMALQLIRQVGAGLAGIHSQGLLHRNIQPKNIIFREGVGIPTLVDWGLQPAHCPPDSLSAYAAPEQFRGGDTLKPSLDIYGLAATLYSLITGQVPTHGSQRQSRVPNPSPTDLAGLLSPRQFQPKLSPALEAAILQGMALDPSHRPSSLEAWLACLPVANAAASGSLRPPQSTSQPISQLASQPSFQPAFQPSSQPAFQPASPPKNAQPSFQQPFQQPSLQNNSSHPGNAAGHPLGDTQPPASQALGQTFRSHEPGSSPSYALGGSPPVPTSASGPWPKNDTSA